MATLWEMDLPANFWTPAASGGCLRSRVNNISALSFDPATVQRAYSDIFNMPAAYLGGTLKARIKFRCPSTSGKVDFEIAVRAWTPGDNVNVSSNTTFDTANAANKTVLGNTNNPDELIVTLSNKNSVAAGDWVQLRMERDADDGTDDTAADAAFVTTVTLYEEA